MVGKFSGKITKVSFSLPFGIGQVEWEPDAREREAAWSLYVELVTRIAVQALEVDKGLVREALTSLYTIFGSTREILRSAGPKVGIKPSSVGGIAIAVLNNGLRPFLSEWHPKLQIWERQRRPDKSPKEHEISWPEEKKLRAEMEELRKELSEYSDALAEIAGVKK